MVNILSSLFPRLFGKGSKKSNVQRFSGGDSELEVLFNSAFGNLNNLMVVKGESKDYYDPLYSIDSALLNLRNSGKKDMTVIRVINDSIVEFDTHNLSNSIFNSFKQNYSKILNLLK